MRQSITCGHDAVGFDIDPLAVLMSRVWTSRCPENADILAEEIITLAAGVGSVTLPWIDDCEETTKFVAYWFADQQISQLRRLAYSIMKAKEFLPEEAINLLWLALSRTIITKTVGASLAWDVSHSRPHKKRTTNDYDVFNGFRGAIARIIAVLQGCEGQGTASVESGDARSLSRVADCSVDAIFTSPPYLNAIDYLRGHKLSLVWMGYNIPELRSKRSGAVGAERIERNDIPAICERVWKEQPTLSELPANFQGIVKRYVKDASAVIAEYARVIKRGGQMGLVIGDSTLRGTFVSNSGIFDTVAKEHGFSLMHRETRNILQTKRYLPTASASNTLEKRMRQEIVAIYSPA